MRNRNGDLLSTIQVDNPKQVLHFAPSQSKEQITITTASGKITTWEISQIAAPQKLVEHSLTNLASDCADDFEPAKAFQFGSLMIGTICCYASNHRPQVLLFTFDLSHPEVPPKKLAPSIWFNYFARHSDCLFCLADNFTRMIAYQIKEGVIHLLWETNLASFGFASVELRAVNERWVICEKYMDRILVLDAKTGQKRGDFPPKHDFWCNQIWGSDILIAYSGSTLHMFQLPQGEPLFNLKQKQCGGIADMSANKEELLILYQQDPCRVVRGSSWTAPLIETSPASSNPVDPGFLSCLTRLLSYFADFWRWLFS